MKRYRNLKRALAVCGLPAGFDLDGPQALAEAHTAWKRRVVAARNEGDDETAKELSAAWALLRSYGRRWCACGKRKSVGSSACPDCLLKSGKTRKPQLPGAVSYDRPIPLRRGRTNWLQRQLAGLDRIGASRDVHASDGGIRLAALALGFAIHVQPVNGQRDGRKGWFRVWRTEGLTPPEVNATMQ